MEDYFKDYCFAVRSLLGSKIKRMRMLKDMSQKDFAALVGVSPANLCRIESGNFNYNVDTLLLFCFHLHIDLDLTL